MRRDRKANNQGYTLVELIVTILITGIVATIITMFISVSRTTYEEVKKEAILQQEAQMASSYIGDIAIEASECITTAFSIGSDNYKVLTMKAPDSEYISGVQYDYYYIIVWEESSQILRFCKVKDDAIAQADGSYQIPTGSKLVFVPGSSTLDYVTMLSAGGLNIIGNPRALLARYVSSMDVEVPSSSNGMKLTKLTFRLRYHDAEYVLTKNVAGRNLS